MDMDHAFHRWELQQSERTPEQQEIHRLREECERLGRALRLVEDALWRDGIDQGYLRRLLESARLYEPSGG